MKAMLTALWPARTWRATRHALVAVPVGVATTGFLGGLAILWAAAVVSLLTGPEGAWWLAVVYVVAAFAGPMVLPWCGWTLGALHRARIATMLGVEIAAPPGVPAGTPVAWLVNPVRQWGSVATWRLCAYHLLVPFIAVAGGLLVALCWAGAALAIMTGADLVVVLAGAVLLLVAPWVARGVAGLDVRVGQALLGPSRSEKLAQRIDALARSRTEVIEAADAERRRIERDLHDGAQQRLVSLAMNLGMARAALGDDAPDEVRSAIEQAHDEATAALADLREIVRGLHPAVLNDRGLDAALSGIAARAPLPVTVTVAASRCSPTVEAVAYFVVSEALTNVTRHARASHATVAVRRVRDRLRIVVTDDGRGGAHPSAGSGLHGLRQRAASVDGTLTIDSPAGGPTILTVELPCAS